MYAKLIAIGRLGRDGELRPVSNGQLIRFSIAHSQKLSTGEEKTQWIECSYWRGVGESTEVIKYLKKGAMVLVEGTPSIRLYTRQDNTPGVSFECRVTNLRLLVYPSVEGGGRTVEVEEEPMVPELPDESDLPF